MRYIGYQFGIRWVQTKRRRKQHKHKNKIKQTKKESRKRLKTVLDEVITEVWESEDDYPTSWETWFNQEKLFESLDQVHYGDCTKQCCTCMRCYVERLIGCETNIDNSKYIKDKDAK